MPTLLRILDNASGIGTLVFRALIPNLPADQIASITADDLDENYLAVLRRRVPKDLATKIHAARLDQQSPGLESDHFDYVFNNFGVFFAPSDETVPRETLRMLKPASGVAGFTSWNKISWWTDVLLPALKKHLPDAPPLPDPKALFPGQDFALACALLAKSIAARAWPSSVAWRS
ncbi:hypothetical protein DFJ73DRAFT_782766 [Zopfochytrium polystomum]|nr:hypothetical protein DFJ73DRAFT_782766 [Zopfochytrium polystomum]